jgi:hypothetical protein
MSVNCYATVLSQKTAAFGHCVQSAIQHVIRAPRLAEANEWATSLISARLAVACAILLVVVLLVIDNRKPRRRFT